jgi:diphthamide synthase (EF-2-diphthine--ammonia ligase)
MSLLSLENLVKRRSGRSLAHVNHLDTVSLQATCASRAVVTSGADYQERQKEGTCVAGLLRHLVDRRDAQAVVHGHKHKYDDWIGADHSVQRLPHGAAPVV